MFSFPVLLESQIWGPKPTLGKGCILQGCQPSPHPPYMLCLSSPWTAWENSQRPLPKLSMDPNPVMTVSALRLFRFCSMYCSFYCAIWVLNWSDSILVVLHDFLKFLLSATYWGCVYFLPASPVFLESLRTCFCFLFPLCPNQDTWVAHESLHLYLLGALFHWNPHLGEIL